MRRRRYQVRDELVISATPERIFDVATDASLVPLYADEIHSIDVLERNDRNASVRSVLKVAGMRIPFRYRYHYRRPRAMAGFQEGRSPVIGFFWFTFKASQGKTRVTHAEGIQSRVPGLAWLCGVIYFRLLGRGNLRPELQRLAALATTRS
jgi:hypothetical protein